MGWYGLGSKFQSGKVRKTKLKGTALLCALSADGSALAYFYPRHHRSTAKVSAS